METSSQIRPAILLGRVLGQVAGTVVDEDMGTRDQRTVVEEDGEQNRRAELAVMQAQSPYGGRVALGKPVGVAVMGGLRWGQRRHERARGASSRPTVSRPLLILPRAHLFFWSPVARWLDAGA